VGYIAFAFALMGLPAGTAPGGAVTFFCRKESHQRNLPHCRAPLRGVPCASRSGGASRELATLRFAQTTARLIPPLLRCSARQMGVKSGLTKGAVAVASDVFSSAPAEQRRDGRKRLARV
jgi:hypothetical protein